MSITTFNEVQKFKESLKIWFEENVSIHNEDLIVLFFSYGNPNQRCKVWNTADSDLNKVLKRTLNFIDKQFENDRKLAEFLKFDIAKNIKKEKWVNVNNEIIAQKHNNHFRKGLSFDSKFEISFLEQEIYGKALIRGLVYNEPNFCDEKNINDAIKTKYNGIKVSIDLSKLDTVWTFDTVGMIYENNKIVRLQSTGQKNGIRVISDIDYKKHIKDIVLKNAEFLHDEILENGAFQYGYFPAFNRNLKSYNTVRHCTAVYALLETLEVEYNSKYLEKINESIQYALDTFYKVAGRKAYMIDGNEPDLEIKLGSNAAAIFMLAKYQEITKDNKYQKYAEKLAQGIKSMVSRTGETTHVLNYPSLEVKEKFRIVYYDGEAALGLLRLYQLNHDEKLLKTVKLMFSHFIKKDYDQYHDHWLSYCTNELTKICPEEQYFRFGMNNYLKHMDFIKNRKTAYATFLEMMMSAYKMVVRMKEEGFVELYAESKFEELKELIELRVEFQRSTGFFYPEMAMYMKEPSCILNAFYVRHDRFRTRIDDQEHNLSGYVAYLNYFHK
jgi:hypothetical protein